MKLTKLQNQALEAIGQSDLAQYFYWTGGTLLSTHFLHHRVSEDLDFFSDELIPEEVVLAIMNNIKKKLRLTNMSHVTHQNRQRYQLRKGNAKLSIEFVYFPFPVINKPKKIKRYPVKIASLQDLAVNKIYALYERGEPKDVIDIYYICKTGKYSLNKLINLASKKFDAIDGAAFAGRALEAASKLVNIQPLMEKKTNAQKLRAEIEDLFSSSGKKYLSNLLI